MSLWLRVVMGRSAGAEEARLAVVRIGTGGRGSCRAAAPTARQEPRPPGPRCPEFPFLPCHPVTRKPPAWWTIRPPFRTMTANPTEKLHTRMDDAADVDPVEARRGAAPAGRGDHRAVRAEG